MKHLITAALIYSNGELHLGHLKSTYLPADIYTRYLKASGDEAIYVCATDDHGTPIIINAEKAGEKPEDYTEKWHERDKKEFAQVGIDFDVFHRTHSEENKKMTLHFYKKLKEKGHVYEKKVKEYYCKTDDKYLPDRYVRGVCPHCGAEDQYSDQCEECSTTLSVGELINPYCILCENTPTLKESKHSFFKLTSFSKKIKKWLKRNDELQEDIVGYVNNWVEEGLKDWDISRNLDWGFKIPGTNQVFYVWFDAPIGYVSSTKKWCEENNEDFREWWSEDTSIVHFVGKDIIYHHYLFWPSMLMGTEEFALPDKIPTRGFLNLEGEKFSKSKGNYVSIKEYLKHFEPDQLRFYMTLITPNKNSDSNWSWEDFKNRINKDLVGNVGNFLYRTTYFVNKYFDGQVPKPGGADDFTKNWEKKVNEIKEHMNNVELKKALEKIIGLSAKANQYFQKKEPWKKIKKNKDEAGKALGVCANACKNLCSLMYPFTPLSMKAFSEQINTEINWGDVSEFKNSWKIKKTAPAYSKVEDKQIQKVKKK